MFLIIRRTGQRYKLKNSQRTIKISMSCSLIWKNTIFWEWAIPVRLWSTQWLFKPKIFIELPLFHLSPINHAWGQGKSFSGQLDHLKSHSSTKDLSRFRFTGISSYFKGFDYHLLDHSLLLSFIFPIFR